MTPDQLELAITHYLDGTLPHENVAALEQALAADAAAMELLRGHERLTALLRSQALPEMDWAELSRDFSAVVTGTVDESVKASDKKLNALFGALPPAPVVAWGELSQRISASIDSHVEAEIASEDALDDLLKSAPMPAVNWNALSGRISDAIAAEAAATATPVERPAVIGRIGFARRFNQMAIAACMLIATGLGIAYFNRPNNGNTVAVNPVPPVAVAVVETPQVETSTQAAIAEVSIGPSKAYAASDDDEIYRSGVASRSQVVIALPVGNDDDSEHTLGFE